jgi:hypothetical protein
MVIQSEIGVQYGRIRVPQIKNASNLIYVCVVNKWG